MPDAVLLLDPRGRLLKFNPAAERALGVSLAPQVGRAVTRWVRDIEAMALRHQVGFYPQQFRQYALETLRQPACAVRRQFQQVRDGEARYIDEIVAPVSDSQDQLAGWLIVWRDSTEEHKLALLRQELSSMVIHDLRNPITSIISGLTMLQDLLAEGETDLQTIAEVAQIARTSAENTLNLAQSLLDVSRLEQSALALDCESLALIDLIDAATASVLGLAISAGISITVGVPADLPTVWIDGEKIQRVLVNLLDNALRHTPQGGQIAIEAAPLLREQAVMARVEDSGPGIPLEDRSRIFDRFAQLNQLALRGHKGTGLGLTYCKLAIEAHGARIWVEDSRLGGAAFCFTLPVAPKTVADKPSCQP